MPYIQKDRRPQFSDLAERLGRDAESAGELNYILTMVVRGYMNAGSRGIRYDTLNEIVGVLEACKLEFYRRQVAPYEEMKIAENGDVYF